MNRLSSRNRIESKQGNNSTASPVGARQTERLSAKAYQELEASIIKPDIRLTDPGSMGIRIGIDLVLATIRKDFTLV